MGRGLFHGIGLFGEPAPVGLAAHVEFQRSPRHDLIVGDVSSVYLPPIQPHGLNISVFVADSWCLDC